MLEHRETQVKARPQLADLLVGARSQIGAQLGGQVIELDAATAKMLAIFLLGQIRLGAVKLAPAAMPAANGRLSSACSVLRNAKAVIGPGSGSSSAPF